MRTQTDPCAAVEVQMEIAERLNAEEAQMTLGCTRRKLKELRSRRLIKFYRLGHKTVSYDRHSILRYLKSREVPAIGECS
ncbi:MAG TPA: hypothetical protein PKE12_09865 [Kiritimatiellia bacterium]|nr:hypothetical protein [Kiritimatiellia bacterium]